MNLSDVYIAFVLGTLILIMFAFTLIMFLIYYKKKQHAYINEKLELEHLYQTQLLQTQIEVQEQSFKHFSEEIHDNVGQSLSVIKLQLYKIRTGSNEGQIIDTAEQSAELLSKAISDLRNVSHTLNSSFISKAGLSAAIRKELGYINSARGMNCQLYIHGDEYNLSDDSELLVFRIIQEAVANALKHGVPTDISVHLNYHADKLIIEIKDNGTGFDVTTPAKDGIGLNNMQLRADILKGILTIDSAKDKGTSITLEINR